MKDMMKTAIKMLKQFGWTGLLAFCLPVMAQTRSVTLVWDYSPGDGITNYSFNIHSSTNAAAPLPWPMQTAAAGTNSATFNVQLAPNVTEFFYMTGFDSRSNPTNYVAESDPSNVVQYRLLPNGGLTIRKGP